MLTYVSLSFSPPRIVYICFPIYLSFCRCYQILQPYFIRLIVQTLFSQCQLSAFPLPSFSFGQPRTSPQIAFFETPSQVCFLCSRCCNVLFGFSIDVITGRSFFYHPTHLCFIAFIRSYSSKSNRNMYIISRI